MRVRRWALTLRPLPRAAGEGILAIVLLTPLSHSVEMKPIINGELLLGQYWYNGADSTLGGIASLTASPYLKFNDRWSVVPLYQGRYQGTKQVSDFTGGGTLFQDSQDHNLSVKGIRSFENGLKLKAITGYGIEWLRETRDEGWTKGLYDNKRLSAGTEAEWGWAENQFARLSYDYYRVHFPNYQSLESQAGSDLGRELAQPDVLDNQNHRFSLGGQTVLPGHGLLAITFSQTLRSFSDQKVVAPTGSLTADSRNDSIQSASLEGTWPVWGGERGRLLASLGYGWTHLLSDQNSYDASRTLFLGNYYAYVQQSLFNRWVFVSPSERPWTLQMAWSLSRQKYSDRLTQDNLGSYGTDKTRVDNAAVSLGFGYPLAKQFQLKGQVSLGWSDSNNTFTRVYQYHYHTASYLLGFSYAY